MRSVPHTSVFFNCFRLRPLQRASCRYFISSSSMNFFGDKRNSSRSEKTPWYLVLIATFMLTALAFVYLSLFSGVFFSYPYAILIVLLGLLVVALGFTHRAWRKVLRKTTLFAPVLPLSLVYQFVLLESELRFFANLNEYT